MKPGWNRRLSRFKGCLWGLLSLAVFACLLPDDGASSRKETLPGGTSTGTESGFSLSGKLVLVEGSPAEGAGIALYETVAGVDGTHPDSGRLRAASRSDQAGRYDFRALPPGIYSVRAEYVSSFGDTLTASRSGIPLYRSKDLGTDTLLSPGTIKGEVLAGGRPVFGAFCFIPGTSYLAITDAAGHFQIGGIAPGNHELAFTAQGFLTTVISPVPVLPGEVTMVDPVILAVDPARQPRPPQDLSVTYNPMTGVVTLRWKSADAHDLAGYLVYRGDTVFTRPQLLIDSIIRDTVFHDTVYRDIRKPDSAVYMYRVKSIDRDGNESPFGKPGTVKVMPPPGIHAPYPGNGSEEMDTAITLGWKLAGAQALPLADVMVFLDTVTPPVKLHGGPGWRDSLGVAGLEKGRTYFWTVKLLSDSGEVKGEVWSFRTTSGPEDKDSSALRFVDIRGRIGHIRLGAGPGGCGSCSRKPAFVGPIAVEYGPDREPLVIQVYRNSRPIPVFPLGNSNSPSGPGVRIDLVPGENNYEMKVWKPGEPLPRTALWFSSERE